MRRTRRRVLQVERKVKETYSCLVIDCVYVILAMKKYLSIAKKRGGRKSEKKGVKEAFEGSLMVSLAVIFNIPSVTYHLI